MILRNKTEIPDSVVMAVIQAVSPQDLPRPVKAVCVRNSKHMSYYGSTWGVVTPVITLLIGVRHEWHHWTGTRTAWTECNTLMESLVYGLAHEFRHVWQLNYQFEMMPAEYDADRYGAEMLARFRAGDFRKINQ